MAPFNAIGKRTMSDQPPVLTPAEVEALNNHASENGVDALAGASGASSANNNEDGLR
jgi:cell division protease FtsH